MLPIKLTLANIIKVISIAYLYSKYGSGGWSVIWVCSCPCQGRCVIWVSVGYSQSSSRPLVTSAPPPTPPPHGQAWIYFDFLLNKGASPVTHFSSRGMSDGGKGAC